MQMIFNADRILDDVAAFNNYADKVFNRFSALSVFFGIDLEDQYCKKFGL